MKKIMFLMAFVALLIVPIMSYDDLAKRCAEDCVSACSAGPAEKYETCLANCLKDCPKPRSIKFRCPPCPSMDGSKTYKGGDSWTETYKGVVYDCTCKCPPQRDDCKARSK